MILIFYFFAAIMVFFGYQSLRGGIDYLKFFQTELAKPTPNYTPFCSIIAPCRGLDSDLCHNLVALFTQDFPGYEIIFVLDSEDDAAFSVIEKLKNGHSLESKTIIAGNAVDSGQKVHNLREAVNHISSKSEVLVFVDSDARPSESWLRNLIAPLSDQKLGAATGYRWFIPQTRGFWSEMRSVWNASIASSLGKNTDKNFCWGGSTAIRREVFEKLEIREKWKGTLSDDFMMTLILNDAKMPIYFVPQALTASVENSTFAEMMEFTNRQIKITQIYAPHLWRTVLIGSFMFSATFFAGIILLFFTDGWQYWLTLFFLLAIFILGYLKAFYRLKAVKLSLKNYEQQLNKSFFYQTFLWVLTQPIYFYNSVSALASQQIIWRGIKYELKSPTDIVIKK